MNNPLDFIRQFDGKIEDGLSIFRQPVFSRPLPSEQIGEGVSVGEGETVYRLASDG